MFNENNTINNNNYNNNSNQNTLRKSIDKESKVMIPTPFTAMANALNSHSGLVVSKSSDRKLSFSYDSVLNLDKKKTKKSSSSSSLSVSSSSSSSTDKKLSTINESGNYSPPKIKIQGDKDKLSIDRKRAFTVSKVPMRQNSTENIPQRRGSNVPTLILKDHEKK